MGHTSRILYSACSPDKTTIVTAGADETLRFWKIFPPTKRSLDLKKNKPKSVLSGGGFTALR